MSEYSFVLLVVLLHTTLFLKVLYRTWVLMHEFVRMACMANIHASDYKLKQEKYGLPTQWKIPYIYICYIVLFLPPEHVSSMVQYLKGLN